MASGAPGPIAPLGRRYLAFLLDGLLLVPVYLVYGLLFDEIFGPLVVADPAGAGLLVVAVDPVRVVLELTLTIVTDAAYYAGSWATWGATPGQRACGVAVRAAAPDGTSAGRGRGGTRDGGLAPAPAAAARWAVLQLPPLCVGTLGAAGAVSVSVVALVNATWFGMLLATTLVDPQRRGLHDRAGATLVVRAPGARPG